MFRQSVQERVALLGSYLASNLDRLSLQNSGVDRVVWGSSPEGVSWCQNPRRIAKQLDKSSPWIGINEACGVYWNLHCPDEKDDHELNQALLLEAGFVPLYP